MNVTQLFKVDRLEELIADGMVAKTKHPDLDLWIYNYTKQAQYKSCWNDVTIACRGLILDAEYNVIARPFPKFFNIEERSRSDIIWKRPFQLFEKLDGSLGILYPSSDGFAIATRGSFASDQAIRATQIWRENYSEVVPQDDYTYCFEIIYPQNRIVVDYGTTKDLYFLAAVHIQTGANLFAVEWPGPVAKRYEVDEIHPRDIKEKMPLDDNCEGYVLYFPHANERVKVKFDEYCRLHRIVTGVSTKTIWEYKSQGKSLDELIEAVPDEFFDWVNKVSFSLQEDFDSIWDKNIEDFHNILDTLWPNTPTLFQEEYAKDNRRKFADKAYDCENSPLLFNRLDRKFAKLRDNIWKMIKPVYEKPFSEDLDDA
jgi:hypothetical protein